MNKPKVKTYQQWLDSGNEGELDEYNKALEGDLKALNKWLMMDTTEEKDNDDESSNE